MMTMATNVMKTTMTTSTISFKGGVSKVGEYDK